MLVQTKETNKAVADSHAELAKTVSKDVVLPLKKLVSSSRRVAWRGGLLTSLLDSVER